MMFSYYANCSEMLSNSSQLKSGKILNKRYLRKYLGSVLEPRLNKFASQKKQNDSFDAVAIATLSACLN